MCWHFLFRKRINEKNYRDKKFLFYTPEQIAADKTKAQTYAYAFVVDPDAPTFMIAPGGGYGMVCITYEGIDFAEELNKRGYNAFVLHYRVAPDAAAPNPQSDMAAMISYVFANGTKFGLNNQNYAVMGFSAGGHLAASFAAANVGYAAFSLPKPRFAALAYAVITLGEHTHRGTMLNLTGGDEALCEEYSVEKHADDYPPTYLWYCEDDKAVPGYNSESLYAQLTARGISAKLTKFSKSGHGLGMGRGTEAQGWLDEMLQFAQPYLR